MQTVTKIDYLTPINDFLRCETPVEWVDAALENIDILLIDHANCEKKAASTAMTLMYRYIDNYPLLNKMSRLAREELRHFEQVIAIMEKRNINYVPLSASRYAGQLHDKVSRQEPERIVDTLIVGAIIEARSCERFARLAPFLDQELGSFYFSLLKSEARHFQDYLQLAAEVSPLFTQSKVDFFLKCEQQLIEEKDSDFRFHSGPL